MTMMLYVMPGEAFRKEVRANAARASMKPERWLERAVAHFARILPLLNQGEGVFAAGKGDLLKQVLGTSLEEYRGSSSLRLTPGIAPQDLGGYPPGSVIWKVPIDEDVATTLKDQSGAETVYEAIGYAIWRQSRFANTMREDYPDWEPGILLSDGIFRSLTHPGAMRRLPGSTYDPVVRRGLPISETIKGWLRVLAGVEVIFLKPNATPSGAPNQVSYGFFSARLADGHPAGELFNSSAAERCIVRVNLYGVYPNEARSLHAAADAESGEPLGNELRISIADLLYDPASIGEMRVFVKLIRPSTILVSAGVLPVHGTASPQSRPNSKRTGYR